MQRLHWAFTGGLAVAVVVLSVLVFRQSKATNWEYNQVQREAGVTIEDNSRWKDQMDRMGNEGWEAVGYTSFEHQKQVYVVILLKRPKP
jgi:hypothetical protein